MEIEGSMDYHELLGPDTPVTELGLSTGTLTILHRGEVETAWQLLEACVEDILSIDGAGWSMIPEIQAAFLPFGLRLRLRSTSTVRLCFLGQHRHIIPFDLSNGVHRTMCGHLVDSSDLSGRLDSSDLSGHPEKLLCPQCMVTYVSILRRDQEAMLRASEILCGRNEQLFGDLRESNIRYEAPAGDCIVR